MKVRAPTTTLVGEFQGKCHSAFFNFVRQPVAVGVSPGGPGAQPQSIHLYLYGKNKYTKIDKDELKPCSKLHVRFGMHFCK